MRLTFCGAARTVTGSCFLLEGAGRRLLVDCGMFQGGREEKARNARPFPFAPDAVDAVLLTHAHIDHSGLLPRLVREGFRGRIHATEATADLCRIMLPDSAHIQEMEAEWRARKARRAGFDAELSLYSVADAEDALKRFAAVKYDESVALFPGIRARFLDAGHILGSAIIELWVEEGGRETKIVFSGDLGQRGAPIIRDPAAVEEADYLLVESTYGDRLHGDAASRREQLAATIRAAERSGGNLVIPAFAVGRTQEMLYDLKELILAGEIGPPKVYIDSPMAVSATEIFRRHPDCFDEETGRMLDAGESPFDFPGLHFVRTVEESRALNAVERGAIIISASGMCDAGRILHHLKHNLWRPEAHLLFVGYQARGTLGRRLLEGEKNVRILGEEVAVRASVHNIDGYSAHADRDDLLHWLGGIKLPPRAVFLVHGEEDVLAAWSGKVRSLFGRAPVVPAFGETYALAEKAVLEGRAPAPAADDYADLLVRMDAAYRALRQRLAGGTPPKTAARRKLRQALERIIKDLSRVG